MTNITIDSIKEKLNIDDQLSLIDKYTLIGEEMILDNIIKPTKEEISKNIKHWESFCKSFSRLSNEEKEYYAKCDICRYEAVNYYK